MNTRKFLEALTFIIGVPATAGAIAGILFGTQIVFFPQFAPPILLAPPWKILAWSGVVLLLLASAYCLARKTR